MSDPHKYTVGWICAIASEYLAAQLFLDEEHEGPEFVSANDSNNYTLGKSGKHNIVIAVLPYGEYGISSAAGVVKDMLHSFPNVKIGLMVGIGGGAPTPEHDIRLGDVVVSTCSDDRGSVLQYDFGKEVQGREFQQTGFLNQPPAILRTAVHGLLTQYKRKGHQLDKRINDILMENPRLKKEFQRPDPSTDLLYHPTKSHPLGDASSCAKACGDDPSTLVMRPDRGEYEDNPAIHHGLIASSSRLMKDAFVRDALAERNGVLCFEMEAAGLMNHFPCLVIRGICDYSDSHKNKQWQGFAAMMAAAYATDLLHEIHPNKVEAETKIVDTLDAMKRDISDIRSAAQDTNIIVKEGRVEHQQDKINNWLCPPDPSINYNKATQQRHQGSGQWFLQSAAYSAWRKEKGSFLWLHGMPGCGKTILSSAIINDLAKSEVTSRGLLYFFFDFTDISKQSLEGMLRSLSSQLYRKEGNDQGRFNSLYSCCGNGHEQPTTEKLDEAFKATIQQSDEVWILLDALDECQTRNGFSTIGLLSWLETLLDPQQMNLHLLVTSRPEQDIESAITGWNRGQQIIPIRSKSTMNDICAYVHTRVRQHPSLVRWQRHPKIQDEIEVTLTEKANGMFRWVSCQLDTLENCLDPLSLRRALGSMPTTLDETYARILNNTPHEYKHHTIRILQLLTFSERPLRLHEIVDAIAVETVHSYRFQVENRMPKPNEISRYCSSLVAVVTRDSGGVVEQTETEIQLAHFSVKEYLTSNRLEHKIAKYFEESTAKISLAKICLTYFLGLDHSLSATEISEEFWLADYCAEYWMSHVAVAESSSDTVRRLVLEFFSSTCCYEAWLQLWNPDVSPTMAETGRRKRASALYYASLGGLVCVVRMLIDGGSDVNAEGGEYGNILQAASAGGYDKIVRILLDQGADINAKGRHYGSALEVASERGYENIVEMLLDHGADVDAEGGYHGNALEVASAKGHEKIVQMLLDRGADTNNDALLNASRGGNKNMVEILLNHGADIDAESGYNGIALEAASEWGHEKIIQILLDRGADINAGGGYYGNALIAASGEGYEKIARMLLNKGADVNAQGGDLSSALQAASADGHEKIVQMLLDRGADVNAGGGYYGNALRAASAGGYKKIARMLLNKGANVDIDSRYYRNTL